ncbi:MAG: hypothetical protein P8J87_13380, partial [Verrucomicrobiales bacterium]|nr:hypothetical protein [Verrucomicrobiales bacterium]
MIDVQPPWRSIDLKTQKRPYSRLKQPLTRFWAICVVVAASGYLVSGSFGQGVSDVADRELAKRQAAINESTQLVVEGDVLESAGELESAASTYRAAIELLPVAPATERLRARALERYAAASVEWAKELAASGRYAEARATVDGVLVPGIAPDFQAAKSFRSELDDPDYHNPALTAAHVKNVDEVVNLITRAKGFAALGRYDEALNAYESVLRIDRYNTAARRGMEAIEVRLKASSDSAYDHTRANMLRIVDEQWETGIVDPEQGLGDEIEVDGMEVGLGRSTVARKVKSIVIPRVEFFEAKLKEVVEFIAAQSRLLDTSADGNKGINIVLDSGVEGEGLGDRR